MTTNFEKIRAMEFEELALTLTAFEIAIIQKSADELTDILGIERQLLPIADKKELLETTKQWLESESE